MTDDRVLTPREITQRLDRAMLRTWRALMDLRQDEVLFEEVKRSTSAGIMAGLTKELLCWMPSMTRPEGADVD